MTPVSPLKLLLTGAILIALATGVAAQSGRRGIAKSPTPTPQPTPTPSEPQSKPKVSARIHLLVAVNDPTGFESVPLSVPGKALDTCVERLSEAADVAATAAGRRMTRADAVNAAKAEATRYVVWLQVANERDEYGANRDQIYIIFTIFEPGTAKVKKSGRVQHGTGNFGNVGVSVPTTRGAVYSDYAIKETAREAAARILDAFQIRPGVGPR